MLPIAQPLQDMLNAGVQHFAALWKIERTDGTNLFFTDHDCSLGFEDSIYVPAGGFNASARQKLAGMQTHNLEVVGILNSDAITQDDLRSGKYRGAKISEYIVDWRRPWAGAIATTVWWVSDTEFSDGQWKAKISGVTRWLASAIGRVYGRICSWDLGDSNCKFDLAPITNVGEEVTTVDTSFPRKRFIAGGLAGALADSFTYGKLIFTTGPNAGIVSEVKKYLSAGGEITLYIQLPNNITAGDVFTVIRGCDKLFSTCKNKFNNVINFGGFPTVPGTQASLQYPNAKG